MQTFDVLDPNLDLKKSRLLEASAGTGKTFAIEHIIARLVEEGTPINEILAVTFTRGAAHEMKERIRKTLESSSTDRARSALALFDEAQVFTIHGFCHRMLKEFAFEANVSLRSEEEPSTLKKEMEQTVLDFLQVGDPSLSQEVAALLRRSRYDLDDFVAKVIYAMQKKEEATPLPPLPELPEVSYDDLLLQYSAVSDRYKYFEPEAFHSQLTKLAQLLRKPSHSLLMEEKKWCFEKMDEKNIYKKAPPLPKLPLFHQLNEALSAYLELSRDPTEMLKRVAVACRAMWEERCLETESTTFDTLLVKMQQALRAPPFMRMVQGKYKVAIVDEFQDTDPIQWDIFKTLFLNTHLLYLVGDPKQSIYGFRNADIYTYIDAANSMGEKAFLDTNYRSSPPLVEALNSLFSRAPNWIGLPTLPGALSYHPVRAGREEVRIDEPPIEVLRMIAIPGRTAKWPPIHVEERVLFPNVAKEILRLHETYGISFEEMAVLAKDRYHASAIEKALKKWNIPCAIRRTRSLTTTRGFRAIEDFIQALAHPDESKAFFFGPLIKADPQKPFPSMLPYTEAFESRGFGGAFQRLLKTRVEDADPQFAFELEQTADLLLSEGLNATPRELLTFIEKCKGIDPDDDPRLKVITNASSSKVNILTTFASKGLEYEVVFALAMGSRHRQIADDIEFEAEKMRQLYVAFTRAREKLYFPHFIDPNGAFHATPLEQFFSFFGGKIEDELQTLGIPVTTIQEISLEPYRPSQNDEVQSPPQLDPLSSSSLVLTSFTALSKKDHTPLLDAYVEQDLTVKTPHTLPLGAETGVVIHEVMETLFADRSASIEQLVGERLSISHLAGWEETIIEMVDTALCTPLRNGSVLKDLEKGSYMQEMEFLYRDNDHLIKGFADLVFQTGNHFTILDWKTNWLGPRAIDYSHERLDRAMQDHDYYLQAKIYSEALRRYVKQLYIGTDFTLSGAYVFMRGGKTIEFAC